MSIAVEKELPKGWVNVSLDEIRLDKSKTITPKQFKEKQFELYSVPIYDSGFPEIIQGNDIGSNKQIVEEDTVLLCKINPRINRVWIVGNFSSFLKIASTEWIPFFKINGIFPKFLQYFLQNNDFRNFLSLNVSGVGGSLTRIRPSILCEYELALPPLNEQKRIVAKIEELFSLIDSAKDTLEKTQVLLKQYRQSILKHAFEGKLTEEWRKLFHNSESIEDILLKKSIENKKKKIELDFSKLPKLPSNWKWVVFEQITENTPNAIKAGPFGSSLKKESYTNSGYKIYGQEQVLKNDPYYGDYYIDKKKFDELKSCQVKSGDLLISLVGTIGKTLLLPIDCEKGIINPRLIKISFDYEIVNPKYIQQYFNSMSAKIFFKISSHGGTMEIINMGILKKLPIPFQSIEEQNEIISKIEESFSLIEKNEILIDQLLLQYKQIKNSILKQAFEGKLVPQDPNDEPAEVLLERIIEEKNHVQ